MISLTQGAYFGVTTGLILTLWVGIGAQVYKPPVRGPELPAMDTVGCLLKNITDNSTHLFSLDADVYHPAEAPAPGFDDKWVGHPSCVTNINLRLVVKSKPVIPSDSECSGSLEADYRVTIHLLPVKGAWFHYVIQVRNDEFEKIVGVTTIVSIHFCAFAANSRRRKAERHYVIELCLPAVRCLSVH